MKTGLEGKSEAELYALRRLAKAMTHVAEFGPWSWNNAASALTSLVALEFDRRAVLMYIKRERVEP